jgi:hypothetical protein
MVFDVASVVLLCALAGFAAYVCSGLYDEEEEEENRYSAYENIVSSTDRLA